MAIAAYGRYQVLVTAAAMVAQVALLGAPQTIVRFAGRRLPILLMGLHALGLTALGVALAAVALPTIRSGQSLAALGALAIMTVSAAFLSARVKSWFAFRTSLVGEAVGAVVLMSAAAAALISTPARRFFMDPTRALIIESIALAVTVALLFRAADRSSARGETGPVNRVVFASIYTVGTLGLLDVVVFRRLEVYFLEHSPDGLAGVAVLGLALQIATVVLLIPTALLEAWQPRFAIAASEDSQALEREVARRGRIFARIMAVVVTIGTVIPLAAVPLAFPSYRPWLWYIVALVTIRLACAGAGFHSTVIYAAGRHRALFAPAFISATVAIGANALLTSRLGLRGAVVAYGLTQVTLALLTIVAFRRTTRPSIATLGDASTPASCSVELSPPGLSGLSIETPAKSVS
jgi:hypothetical protein